MAIVVAMLLEVGRDDDIWVEALDFAQEGITEAGEMSEQPSVSHLTGVGVGPSPSSHRKEG